MNQRPIRNSLLHLTLAAVFVVVAATGQLHADADKNPDKNADKNSGKNSDKKAAQDAAPRILGTFAGDGVKIVIESVNNQARGQIIRSDQSFTFVGKQADSTITGTFLSEDVAIEFSVTLKGDILSFSSGSRTYLLKRQFDVQSILGTYKGGADSMVIENDNGNFKGFVTLGGNRSPMTATKKGNRLVGHFMQDKKRHTFYASFDGDLMTFSAGIEKIKMRREAGSTAGVQTKRKVRELLLARSAEAIDSTILVSPDNKSVAFATRRVDRLAFNLWFNGVAMKSDYDLTGILFSPNSRRIAHRLVKDSKSYAVIDDVPSDPYDEVIINAESFSEDSGRTIYAARVGKQWRIVVDGKSGPPFDLISRRFSFSPDGQRVAYVGQRGTKWQVVVDGEASPPYEAVAFGRVLFSPDSKHVHYSITRDGKQVPILDGKELGNYDAVANVGFNPQGDRFAFVAIQGSSRTVITDGVVGPRYDNIGFLRFSPDGKKLAVPARVDGQWKMIVNGQPLVNAYDQVSPAQFSPDSKNVAFLGASEGKQFAVVNDKPSAGYDQVRTFAFSPDGNRLAFIARQGTQWFVVVDGKSSYAYESMPGHLKFSPNSKHFVYSARRDGNTYIVIDHAEGKAVWPLLPGSAFMFDDAKKFHTVVRRTDTFLRLDVDILK